MRRDQITEDLKKASFEFFYGFSRFECALKECGYLKSFELGAKAEPNWDMFEDKYSDSYIQNQKVEKFIKLHPKRQIVAHAKELDWKPVGLNHCKSELCTLITMLKTVRNNLFHGGKHSDIEVEDIDRILELLTLGKAALDHLAESSDLESDYRKEY